ncbi:hypothetical protein, partial [Vibrio diabolicus]|uniref:hypothetical protein n=1 Tax=Vibrio diabolicus TaxID=50719 RepID=UPI002F920D61
FFENLKLLIAFEIPTSKFTSDANYSHNALLRCEQRNTKAAAYHLKHQAQRIVKMPRVANHS